MIMTMILFSAFSQAAREKKIKDSLFRRYHTHDLTTRRVMCPTTIYYEDSVTKRKLKAEGKVVKRWAKNVNTGQLELVRPEGLGDDQKFRFWLYAHDAKGNVIIDKDGDTTFVRLPIKLYLNDDDSKYREKLKP